MPSKKGGNKKRQGKKHKRVAFKGDILVQMSVCVLARAEPK